MTDLSEQGVRRHLEAAVAEIHPAGPDFVGAAQASARRRRRRGLVGAVAVTAVLGAGAAVAIGHNTGGPQGLRVAPVAPATSPGGSSPQPTVNATDPMIMPKLPPRPPLPSVGLDEVARGQSETPIVTTPTSYEAATWARGKITFWSVPARGGWTIAGSSTYPTTGDPTPTTVIGSLIPGMYDATFIAHGPYTGDGAADYIVYARGLQGWSPLVGTTTLTLGGPLQDAQRRDAYIRDGHLFTVQMNQFTDQADGSLFPLITRWNYTGNEFSRASDNSFTAALTTAPPSSTATDGCPTGLANGTYRGYLNGAQPTGSPVDVEGNVVGLAHASIRFRPSPPAAGCLLTVATRTPVTIPARSTDGDASRWVTAPAWLFEEPFNKIEVGTNDVAPGLSNYVVPDTLGLAAIAADFGSPEQYNHPRPVQGTVTVKGGKVTALGLTTQ